MIVLVAGPSGSGKSRLARLSGATHLALDDFYFDLDHPGLPMITIGEEPIVDWDDSRSWNCEAAIVALQELVATGSATVPVYSISSSRRTGSKRIESNDSGVIVAEGVFAPEALAPMRTAGLQITPIWLDRPRTLNAIRRLVRDLAERRKPPHVLIRRGLSLWHAESRRKRYALEAGFRPLTMNQARRLLEAGRH
ncbi:uridine kinase [Naumannella halotolerans]|uniref:uridine kinase family protein n=1 Tax=Naumannella halotolerans TaxID=993414 RepID=UPI00370D1A88